MEITGVTVEPVNEGDLRAYVSIVFDDCFAVHGIKIIRRPEGLLIAMARRKTPDGMFMDTAFPIGTASSETLALGIVSRNHIAEQP
jgi:stage V sporulation protein G